MNFHIDPLSLSICIIATIIMFFEFRKEHQHIATHIFRSVSIGTLVAIVLSQTLNQIQFKAIMVLMSESKKISITELITLEDFNRAKAELTLRNILLDFKIEVNHSTLPAALLFSLTSFILILTRRGRPSDTFSICLIFMCALILLPGLICSSHWLNVLTMYTALICVYIRTREKEPVRRRRRI